MDTQKRIEMARRKNLRHRNGVSSRSTKKNRHVQKESARTKRFGTRKNAPKCPESARAKTHRNVVSKRKEKIS